MQTRREGDVNLVRHSTTLRARSNVQFKNLTGGICRLKIIAKSQETAFGHEIEIPDLESRCLPISMINDPRLSLSVYNARFHMWSKEAPLLDLINDNVKKYEIGCSVLFFGKERIEDPTDKRFIFDYNIDIVSGLKLVNSLPYRIEVKYEEHITKRPESGDMTIMTTVPTKPVGINAGQETLLPIGLQIHMLSTISIRIVGTHDKRSSKRLAAKTKWSHPVELHDLFKHKVSNVTDEEIVVPCTFTRSLQSKVRLRKIRDPSKEDINSEYSTTPLIEVYTDLWIQNNSGVPLWYKVKQKSGDTELLGDMDAGPNDFAVRSKKMYDKLRKIGSEAMSADNARVTPPSGPIMGMLDVKSVQIKCDARSVPAGDIVSLQEFGNITTYMPNIEAAVEAIWSSKVGLTSPFDSQEVVCDNVWLGLSLSPAYGVFSKTQVLVITPRYILRNMTSLGIDIFPVQLWKRMRRAATEKEHQGLSFLKLF